MRKNENHGKINVEGKRREENDNERERKRKRREIENRAWKRVSGERG